MLKKIKEYAVKAQIPAKNKANLIYLENIDRKLKKEDKLRKKKFKELQEAEFKISKLLQESATRLKKKIYIAGKFDSTDIQKIWIHLQKIGIPLMPLHKAHVTILYSYSRPQKNIKIKDITFNVKLKAFRIFGKGTPDSPYALVIELDSQQLQNLHRYYKKEYNLKYAYPHYVPHLTVTYDIDRVLPGLKKLNEKQKKTIENIFSKLIPELPKKIKMQRQEISYID